VPNNPLESLPIIWQVRCDPRHNFGDIGSLFDHLIGACQQSLGHRNAYGAGSLEVDDKCERSRLLDWDIGNLCAAEEPQKLPGMKLSNDLIEARPVGDEAAFFAREALAGQ
jgi:hypothetical protein